MQWSELFDNSKQPSNTQIGEFIKTPLWDELNTFLQQTYGVSQALSYSGCSMQKGWNVKYKKSGKSLCTLYPMPGYFIALVVIGTKELIEADALVPFCSDYTQALYQQIQFGTGGKWLMMEITTKERLNDAKSLIALRVSKKNKSR